MFECSSENTIWPDTVLVETVQLCWGDLVAQNVILVGYSVWICLVLSWQNILVIIPRIHWFNVNLKFTLSSLIFFLKGAVAFAELLWLLGTCENQDADWVEMKGAQKALVPQTRAQPSWALAAGFALEQILLAVSEITVLWSWKKNEGFSCTVLTLSHTR